MNTKYMHLTHKHVQDNIVILDHHILANLQVLEFQGPSSEDELVGHDHDLYCSYPTKQDKIRQKEDKYEIVGTLKDL